MVIDNEKKQYHIFALCLELRRVENFASLMWAKW